MTDPDTMTFRDVYETPGEIYRRMRDCRWPYKHISGAVVRMGIEGPESQVTGIFGGVHKTLDHWTPCR